MKYCYCLDCENVYQDDGKTPRRCPSCDSARVVVRSNNELVSGVATVVFTKEDMKQVIHDLRTAVDDYAFAVGQAGNLGGVELG